MSYLFRLRDVSESRGLKEKRRKMGSQRHGAHNRAVFWLFPALLGSSIGLLSDQSQAQTPSTKFQSIRFIVQTGSDDIRSDSSATAELFSVNGQPLQTLSLKAHNAGGWGNNSTHTVEAALSEPLSADEIGRVAVTLTSHNGTFETDDNWNINQVAIQLFSGNETNQPERARNAYLARV